MAIESLLASMEIDVTAVTTVTVSNGAASGCNGKKNPAVTAVTNTFGAARSVTSVTACNGFDVTAEPASILGVTAVTAVTAKIGNGGCDARKARWWLIHYPDREPVEVASFPDATLAEILERHPDAIAAEPFNQTEPIAACSTCTHATYRGACGVPVVAGLSDLPGVICYSPDQGATCPAWLASIPPDLEARILAMAERWAYSGDDLAAALAGARSDPDGWLHVVETDERGGHDGR